jgi:DNA-binding transcriptional ArsR family regulator
VVAVSGIVVGERVELLKAVADPTRLRVLDQLSDEGELCHCELEEVLGVPANRLSFHLRVLRSAGLVGSRRKGRRVSYHVHADALERLRGLLPDATAVPATGTCCMSDTEGVGT